MGGGFTKCRFRNHSPKIFSGAIGSFSDLEAYLVSPELSLLSLLSLISKQFSLQNQKTPLGKILNRLNHLALALVFTFSFE